MDSELFGIRNGHIVDDKLYRGGDVTGDGILFLSKMGVRHVICLKNAKQDSAAEITAERLWVEADGMLFTNIPMDSSGVFRYDDCKKVPEVLAAIAKTEGKVFVGCHHGADRTGVVVACYRIASGWTADRALKEMKLYGPAFQHFAMRRCVREFAEHYKEIK